jgi:hypothetical protein
MIGFRRTYTRKLLLAKAHRICLGQMCKVYKLEMIFSLKMFNTDLTFCDVDTDQRFGRTSCYLKRFHIFIFK